MRQIRREVVLNGSIIGQFVGDPGGELKYQSLRGMWVSEDAFNWEPVEPYSQAQQLYPNAAYVFQSHGLYCIVPGP